MRPSIRSSFLIFCLATFLFGVECFADGLLVGPGTKLPFVERINVADFLAVETKLGVALTGSCSLVILRTDEGQLESVVALRRKTEAEYDILVSDTDNAGEKTPRRLSVPVEAKSAQQIERAVTLRLHRYVMLPAGIPRPEDHRHATWIFQRLKGDLTIAALIDDDYVHMNPAAHDFMEIIYGMYRYATCHPDDRSEVLYEIDRRAIKIVLEEETKR